MKTMGQRVVELEPVHGFAAETTAASVLLGTAALRDAGLHDPRDLQRDHGRRHEPGRPRRPLGRRRQHRHRMGPDDPGGRLLGALVLARPRRPRRALSRQERRMVRLIPKDENFVDLIVEDAENLLLAARELDALLTSYDRLDERVDRDPAPGEARVTRSTGRSRPGSSARSSRRSTARTSTSWRAARRRRRRHPGSGRDDAHLRRGRTRRPEARELAAILTEPGRAPGGGRADVRPVQGHRAPPARDPRARASRRTACRAPRSPGSSSPATTPLAGHQVDETSTGHSRRPIDAAEDTGEIIERIVAKSS